MIINFFGTDSNYLGDAFFNLDGDVNVDVVTASSTRVVLQNPESGIVTTIGGSGLSFDANQNVTGGTITSLTFAQGASTIATFTGINWNAVSFASALDGVAAGDMAPMGFLFNSSGTIQVNAGAADVPLSFEDFEPLLPYLTNGFNVTGTAYSDSIMGSIGNDIINPGTNNYGTDVIFGSEGDDTVNLGGLSPQSYVHLDYSTAPEAIAVDIDTPGGRATVSGVGSSLASRFTDTINGISTPMTGEGVGIIGSDQDDTFDITTAANEWYQAFGQAGNDTFNLNIGGGARLSFNINPTSGIVVDLSTGVVSNDGLGGTDQINRSGPGVLEIRATDYDDSIMGSALNDAFILRGGNDTVDGGLGIDRVRYDRSGIDAGITAELQAGRISGYWQGSAFTHNVSNIEHVRGSNFDDDIEGSARAETLEGRDGDDYLLGGGGSDRYIGGNGTDTAFVGSYTNAVTVTAWGDGLGFTVSSSEGASEIHNDIEFVQFWDDTLTYAEAMALASYTGPTGGDDTLLLWNGDDAVNGGLGNDTIYGQAGNDTLVGDAGDDSLNGGDGNDTLNGGTGNDTLIGGETTDDLRDVIYGGDGDDSILGGYGNDELNAGGGADTVGGGFGADTIFGFDGNDVLTGEAWSDLIYGGEGNDFVNGGFGYDRVNGGGGADRFYHLGVADHGSDWIQDYTAADGDVLLFGGGTVTADDFLVQFAETANAGVAGVTEAFVTYRATGQVLWALIDGGGQAEINLMAGGQVFDLLA